MNIFSLFKKKNKINKVKKDEFALSVEDTELIHMANKILTGRMASVSNGGGSFDNVTLVECTGIIKKEYSDTTRKSRRVRFKTDDSWITGVQYDDYWIVKEYNKYMKTGKLPELM